MIRTSKDSMMNVRMALFPLVLVLVLALACSPRAEAPDAAARPEEAPPRPSAPSATATAAPSTNANADAAVRQVVEQFGQRLRNVSLLGPRHVLEASIRREYGPYATDALLGAWLKDPSKAPGRLTSSPWPERIEIRDVRRAAPDLYVGSGEIVESSSSGEGPRRTPVRVELVPIAGSWRINAFTAAANEESNETAPGEPSPKDAAAVIEAYHAAINAKEYERAWRMWENDGAASGKSLEDFQSGFASTASVAVELGPLGRVEPAAGSRFIAIPVRVTAKSTNGETQRYQGGYVLRRSVVDGATPEQRRWRIARGKLNRAG